MIKKKSDVLVVGAGPTGMIAALLLKKSGFNVRLIGPQMNTRSALTTALMEPALSVLRDIEVFDELSKESAPLSAMRIVDATDHLIPSPTVTFHSHEVGKPYFGLNIPNQALNAVLQNKIQKNVEWIKTTADEFIIQEDKITVKTKKGCFFSYLVVGADGRKSQTRNAAGLFMESYPCSQSAVILLFNHTKSHNFTSTEFYTRNGPFTQSPLPGKNSALVWITSPEKASALYAMEKQMLSRSIEKEMYSMLGRINIDSKPSVFPISKGVLKKFAQNRIALVGEAAHVFPPIGAQGLNLGIRDIKDLLTILLENQNDPGKSECLKKYNTQRYHDIMMRSHAINLLNSSLLSNTIPVTFARSLGLSLLKSSPALRVLLMNEGINPGQSFLKILPAVQRFWKRKSENFLS